MNPHRLSELLFISSALLATRFFIARLICRTAFKVYESGLAFMPSGHPVRIYAAGRIKESRERALPLMRP